jgi:hypothetical protein
MIFTDVQSNLISAGVRVADGLSTAELTRVERTFGFEFPVDLREFLACGLPVSDGWVNWRDGYQQSIHARLGWPLEGICFDIEHSSFWVPEWGPRPPQLSEAFAVAARAVSSAPVLIPIYSHRYIPATPATAGNPVFSVYQTDIIYYGADLLDYLQNEFPKAFGRIGTSARSGTRTLSP